MLVILQIRSDLQYIKEDIRAVERRRIELFRRRDRYSAKSRMLADDPSLKSVWPSLIDDNNGEAVSRTPIIPGLCHMSLGGLNNRKTDARSSANHLIPRKDSLSGSDSQSPTQSGLASIRKRRVHAQVSNHQYNLLNLKDSWLARKYWANLLHVQRKLIIITKHPEVLIVKRPILRMLNNLIV